MRRWVSFHVLLLPETEFRQHLLAVLPIHVLAGRVCIRRTTGRRCRNSISNRGRPWELASSTHLRAVQVTWTIRNRYGYRYAETCIPPAVSLSDGRRLTGVNDLRPFSGRRRYLYLGCRWSQASGAVASRCSGEAKRCRQTRDDDEDDRGRRGSPAWPRQVLLLQKRQKI